MEKSPTNKIAVYFMILILFYAELILFKKFVFNGIRPELLLIATIFFGLHFGIACGVEVGLISGVLKDIFSASTFGVNTFSFFLIGFFSGYLKKKLFKDNFVTQFLFSVICVYAVSGIFFLDLTKGGAIDIGTPFWRSVLYKGLYTGFLAPFLFFTFTKTFER